MSEDFRREYLVRLPLPIAQLYGRTYNAKSPRERHDNAFYLFEAMVKLLAATSTAAYLEEVTQQPAARVPQLDRLLAQLALPSLGQWLGILRELAKHFGTRVDAAAHPWGQVWQQWSQPRKDCPAMLALYRRIKNGPDGEPAGDQACSCLALLEALVQYRNGVFGHGAGRFESFYAQEMGPLLFPAINEFLADGRVHLLGPPAAKLVYITEARILDDGRTQLALRELVGTQGERLAPIELEAPFADAILPNRVALLWPTRVLPLRLDPLLQYRESDLAEEVLFLNRDRNGKQVEYLSYTTGRTERDRSMLPALAALLSQVTQHQVDQEKLQQLSEQSLTETPSVETLFADTIPVSQELGEYQLLAELGRGGMGVVYLAKQKSLGRWVALKMLPQDLAADEVALARFKREIRHLARCDDPHIVKVLDSGNFPDGRLYYTMEYVPGSDLEMVWRELSGMTGVTSVSHLGNSTWAQAVLSASRKQRSKAEGSRSGRKLDNTSSHEPSNPPLPLPPLPELPNLQDDPGSYVRRVVILARDVARALQTIHEQGIIHRDIKPANLMLTPDGSRVVLMDFGLAKGQTQSLSASRQGGLLGTLRYAAPEQLAAANLKIGPTADVRGLGVTLWELLTRQRLFGNAEDEARLTQEVLTADVPRLRTIDPQFDRDLEAIVARATERRIADRIPSAGQLAEYLQLWLDRKPLPIRPPGTRELLARVVRENRTVVAVTGIALGVILLTTVAAFLQVTAAKARTEAALAASQRHGELTLTTLQSVIYDLDRELKPIPGAHKIRSKLLTTANEGLIKISNDLAGDARVDVGLIAVHLELARLFSRIGNADGLGGLERSHEQYKIALSVADTLRKEIADLRPLQRLIASLHVENGDVLLQLGQLDQAQAEFESGMRVAKALTESDPEEADARISMAGCLAYLGKLNLQLGKLTEASQCFTEQMEINKALLAASPHDRDNQANLSYAYQWMGKVQLQNGNLQEALHYFSQDYAIVEGLYANDSDTWRMALSSSASWMGQVLLKQGDLPGAQRLFGKRLELVEQLAAIDPDAVDSQAQVAYAHHWLGRTAMEAGNLSQAKDHFDIAATNLGKLAERDPQNMEIQSELGLAHGALGDIHYRNGDLQPAQEHYQTALRVFESMVESEPKNNEARHNLATMSNGLGSVFRDLGQLDDAHRTITNTIRHIEMILAAHSGAATVESTLATSHRMLGELEKVGGHLDLALQHFQQDVAISQRLAEADKVNAATQANYANALDWLAQTHFEMGAFDLAEKYFRQENGIWAQLAEGSPSSVDTQSALAISYRWLGRLALNQQQYSESKQILLKDLALTQRRVASEGPSVRALGELAASYNWLERVCIDSGDLTAAIDYGAKCVQACESAVAIDTANAYMQTELLKACSLLGESYMTAGQLDSALLNYHRSRDLAKQLRNEGKSNSDIESSYAWILNNLGTLNANRHATQEAREAFQESIRTFTELTAASPSNLDLQMGLASSYRGLGRLDFTASAYDNALESFTKELSIQEGIVADQPDRPSAELDLGYCLSWLGSSYARLNQVDEALIHMSRWRDIAKKRFDQQPSVPSAKTDYLFALGDVADLHYRQGKLTEAIAERSEALRLAPDDASHWNARGNLYFAQKDWKNAIADYSQAITISPMSAIYWQNRANTYLEAMQKTEALQDINEALRLEPENAEFKAQREKIETAP